MDDNWHLTPMSGNVPAKSLAFYDGKGAMQYYSAGGQWFFEAGTGKPAFYVDGRNMYWADGRPILLNIDKTLLDPLTPSASAQIGRAHLEVFGGRK